MDVRADCLGYPSPFKVTSCRHKLAAAIPTAALGGLKGCEMLRIPHCLGNRLTDGNEVGSLTRQLRNGCLKFNNDYCLPCSLHSQFTTISQSHSTVYHFFNCHLTLHVGSKNTVFWDHSRAVSMIDVSRDSVLHGSSQNRCFGGTYLLHGGNMFLPNVGSN
jgi:hypothetical protein